MRNLESAGDALHFLIAAGRLLVLDNQPKLFFCAGFGGVAGNFWAAPHRTFGGL